MKKNSRKKQERSLAVAQKVVTIKSNIRKDSIKKVGLHVVMENT